MVKAYITNADSSSVSVINTTTNTVIQTLNVGEVPWGVAVTPDGTAVWICRQNGVLIFDTALGNQTSISPITTGLVNPILIAISPDGTKAFVSDRGAPATYVRVFDTTTGEALSYSPVAVGSSPYGIAVSPDNSKAFVACRDTGYVYVFYTATGDAVSYSPVLVGDNPYFIALSPDGSTAFVTVASDTSSSVVAFNTSTGAATSFSPITVGTAPNGITVSSSGEAYVSDYENKSVSVFNTSTGAAASYSPISLGSSSSPGPAGVCLTPDGTALYVANENTNEVLVVSTSSHSVTNTIAVGTEPVAYGQFIQPVVPPIASVFAYIANSGANTVSAIDLVGGTTTNITVGTLPTGIAVSPDGSRVYVANYSSGNVSVICTTTNAVIATLTVESNPFGVAISPNGNNIYVANKGDNSLSVINASNFAVTTIRTGIGTQPTGVAVSPDNSTVYVTNYGSGNVSVLSADTGTLIATVSVGTNPYGIVLSPDGTLAYVANQGSTSLSVINTSTYVATPITAGVGSEPTALALNPAGTILYVSNYSAGTVSSFNANTYAHIEDITVGTNPYGISFTPDGTTVYVVNYGSNTISIVNASTNTVSSTITLTSGSSPISFGQFLQPPSTPMTAVYVPPQGRLTLTSNTPVMTADATGVDAEYVYYTPYQGNIVPIYNGANMVSYTFSQLTMALNTSNQTSGNLYDLFVFLNSGIVTIGAGPAWSSATPGSSSRGTGAGTTQLQQIDGLWVNENAITLKNGTTTYSSVPAGEATYVGTVYMTANGQTAMQFKPTPAAGGSNNVLGVWNAYNRVRITSQNLDSTSSWSYSASTVRPADGNTNNRISYVDGLQQSRVEAEYVVNALVVEGPAASATAYIGLNTTTTPAGLLSYTTGDNVVTLTAKDAYQVLGFAFVQALENNGPGGETATFNGANCQMLQVSLEM